MSLSGRSTVLAHPSLLWLKESNSQFSCICSSFCGTNHVFVWFTCYNPQYPSVAMGVLFIPTKFNTMYVWGWLGRDGSGGKMTYFCRRGRRWGSCNPRSLMGQRSRSPDVKWRESVRVSISVMVSILGIARKPQGCAKPQTLEAQHIEILALFYLKQHTSSSQIIRISQDYIYWKKGAHDKYH